MSRYNEWINEMMRTGVRGKHGQSIRFGRLDYLPDCLYLHAYGETFSDGIIRVAVSFGPEHGFLNREHVIHAMEEVKSLVPEPEMIIFSAFHFDADASMYIDNIEWPGVIIKAQMNADLLTEDLKKNHASNESFWIIGTPDVEMRRTDEGKIIVEVRGVKYYNTETRCIESGNNIALWMLDTDYDWNILFPRQVFFPMSGEKDGWSRLTKKLKTEIDESLIDAYRGMVSLPFDPGDHQRVAVKVVDDRSIDSIKVLDI